MTVDEVDFKGDTIFADFNHAHGIAGREVSGVDVFHAGDAFIAGDDMSLGAAEAVQDGKPARQAYPGTQGADFQRKDVVKAVNDQAADTVRIAMNDAVGIGGFVQLEEVTANADGFAEFFINPVLGHPVASVVHDAERRTGFGVPESCAEDVAIAVINGDEVSCLRILGDATEHTGENGGIIGEVLELYPGRYPVFTAFRCLIFFPGGFARGVHAAGESGIAGVAVIPVIAIGAIRSVVSAFASVSSVVVPVLIRAGVVAAGRSVVLTVAVRGSVIVGAGSSVSAVGVVSGGALGSGKGGIVFVHEMRRINLPST